MKLKHEMDGPNGEFDAKNSRSLEGGPVDLGTREGVESVGTLSKSQVAELLGRDGEILDVNKVSGVPAAVSLEVDAWFESIIED